ncbi:hypothetical protein [Amycolatopsis sp. NPDC004079]|uniref:hypothetical protein n=1 Tax=Amycolatopsis sp. NPDC004079 TaxID=3154549 RepID=UPI0033A4D1B9
MELPGPDPEAMSMAKQLETALIVAATSQGNAAAAIDIAGQMVERQLVAGPRGRMLAMGLIELSLQHAAEAPSTPDPYAKLAQHLVQLGVCTQFDLKTAFLSRVLNSGLAQGWLEADLYDQLAAAGGEEPAFQDLLTRIERR